MLPDVKNAPNSNLKSVWPETFKNEEFLTKFILTSFLCFIFFHILGSAGRAEPFNLAFAHLDIRTFGHSHIRHSHIWTFARNCDSARFINAHKLFGMWFQHSARRRDKVLIVPTCCSNKSKRPTCLKHQHQF